MVALLIYIPKFDSIVWFLCISSLDHQKNAYAYRMEDDFEEQDTIESDDLLF